MPGTARDLGLTVNGKVDERLDPIKNLNAAAEYLVRLLRRFGTYEKALAAYNGGPSNVVKYGGIPPFKETQHYVETILRKAKR